MTGFSKVIQKILLTGVGFALAGLLSCHTDKSKSQLKNNEDHLYTLLSPQQTNVVFRNDVSEDSAWNILLYNYSYNGGGVATGDLNNDGLPDLVFTSNQHGARVYLNKGGLKFEDVTAKCGLDDTIGWTTGVTLADVDGDGWLDIYVSKSGPKGGRIRENRLYINNKNLSFTERGREFGLNDGEPSTNAVFFDYDNDGDLDCFIINHPENFDQILQPLAFTDTSTLPTGRDRMLENVNGHFVDVTEKAGLAHSYGYGLSVSVSDVNGDGYDDLFIANDYLSDDQLYINNGNKTFTNQTAKYLSHTSLFAMGSDFGDINNDGKQDLMVVDMKPDNHFRIKNNLFFFPMEYYYSRVNVLAPHQFIQNSLQLANDTGAYSEISQLSGLDKTDWSWNVLIQDFDNDGWNDIHITNGTKRDQNELDFVMLNDDELAPQAFSHDERNLYKRMPTTLLKHYAYRNKRNLQFEDVSEKWGLDAASIANGAAYADLDGDGDLDLVVNNTDSVAFIFRNNADKMPDANYLRIRLIGAVKNTFGLGAMVKVHAGTLNQTKELENGRGFESCSEPILHFGLGEKQTVDSLEIFWKDGRYSLLKNIKADRLLTISEDSSRIGKVRKFTTSGQPHLLAEKPKTILNFVHHESKFNDFKRDRLLPYQLSKEGPGMAVADVNGDGMDDIFITNGAGNSGKLFLQHKNGTFTESAGQPWSNDITYEGLGAVFFDANGDGKPDLYIATGSNEFKEGDKQLKDKLYINDGKGHFK
ncbi:MAG: RNA-binding protein, partial [Bacteroidota bacterium]|nr:RNA-binding protein [Bacteroidota bacterium]